MTIEEIITMNNIANIIKQNTHKNDNIIAVKYNCENCGKYRLCDHDFTYRICICKSDVCKNSLKCRCCSTKYETICFRCANDEILCNPYRHIGFVKYCDYECCPNCSIKFCRFQSNRFVETNYGGHTDIFSLNCQVKNRDGKLIGKTIRKYFCNEQCFEQAKKEWIVHKN